MKILRARLLKAKQDERLAAERAKDRKEQLGSGERSDKIRTYNYKDNRVSDHRVILLLELDQVLDGDLDDFVDALVADHETTRLANLESKTLDIKNIPEHELARLREKAKELSGSTTDYQSEYSSPTRRVNHVPLQYIEEYVPFYSISLKVDERCLIPRPETEYLVQIIKDNIESPKKVLDVGTGSGCITLMMKSIFPNSSNRNRYFRRCN